MSISKIAKLNILKNVLVILNGLSEHKEESDSYYKRKGGLCSLLYEVIKEMLYPDCNKRTLTKKEYNRIDMFHVLMIDEMYKIYALLYPKEKIHKSEFFKFYVEDKSIFNCDTTLFYLLRREFINKWIKIIREND
jgi:hypothetical protein